MRKEPSLKGTFASVLLLGAFVAATWVLVFVLFISRG
ncbi:cytochrome c oxidase subunit 2A [Paenibacillus sp. P26]|nr:cytochrome c oxidase subunit 2A [Paenibacillus sp. P26]UUZ96621.1 cytochrome c oxidase subunit 2A [Paenibacillus sp. P25]